MHGLRKSFRVGGGGGGGRVFSPATPVAVNDLETEFICSAYLLTVVSRPAGRIAALVTALSIVFFPFEGASQGTCQQLHVVAECKKASKQWQL